MKRGIFLSLVLATALTPMLWTATAWAPPRAGSNARTVLNDIRVCRNGGTFQVAYTPAANESPDRILIKAGAKTLVNRPIHLRQHTVTFPGLTLPTNPPEPDPLNGVRTLSRTRTYHWRRQKVGTTLQVTIFGVADVQPPAGEEFPVPGTPDIVVANCLI
jgi:hypothetical protein